MIFEILDLSFAFVAALTTLLLRKVLRGMATVLRLGLRVRA